MVFSESPFSARLSSNPNASLYIVTWCCPGADKVTWLNASSLQPKGREHMVPFLSWARSHCVWLEKCSLQDLSPGGPQLLALYLGQPSQPRSAMTLTLALPQDWESSSCSKPDKHHSFLPIQAWNNGERVIEGKIVPEISRPLWQTKPCSSSCFCISYLSPLRQVTRLIPLTHLQNGRVSTLQDPVRSWPWPSFSARHTGSSCLTAGELTEVQRNDLKKSMCRFSAHWCCQNLLQSIQNSNNKVNTIFPYT